MEAQFNHIHNKFQNLVHSEFLDFEAVALMKNVMGVYAIYDNDLDLVYLGSTNKFHVRFGTDLKYESTHTLMRKLLKVEKFKNRIEAAEFLINKCKIKIERCDSKREAEALEGMAIFVLDPAYNK